MSIWLIFFFAFWRFSHLFLLSQARGSLLFVFTAQNCVFFDNIYLMTRSTIHTKLAYREHATKGGANSSNLSTRVRIARRCRLGARRSGETRALRNSRKFAHCRLRIAGVDCRHPAGLGALATGGCGEFGDSRTQRRNNRARRRFSKESARADLGRKLCAIQTIGTKKLNSRATRRRTRISRRKSACSHAYFL